MVNARTSFRWMTAALLLFPDRRPRRCPVDNNENDEEGGRARALRRESQVRRLPRGEDARDRGQWRSSEHAREGVGCWECHSATAAEPGAFEHQGATITTVITPNACAGCHGEIVAENQRSHTRRRRISSARSTTFWARSSRGASRPSTAAGSATARQWRSEEPGRVRRKNAVGAPMIDPSTWPNTGIGRVNLDGSRGSCTACHRRHAFSKAMARQPEVCGKCRLGPDHPQAEIYEESKHGIAYRTQKSGK